jgi:hypothetical protein
MAGTALVATFLGTAVLIVLQGGPGAPHLAIASAGPIRLSYGAPWRASQSGPPGADAVAQPVLLRRDSVLLAVGSLIASSPIPGGQPPWLIARFRRPELSVKATFDGHPATRYTWRVNDRRLVALVVPTTTSDLAILCAAPNSHRAAIGQCLTQARLTRVTGVVFIAPGVNPQSAARVDGALRTIAAATRRADRVTGSPQRRATVFRAIVDRERYETAIIAATPTLDRNHAMMTALVSALRRETDGFTALSRASARSDRTEYAETATRLSGTGRALQQAAARLASAGFAPPRIGSLTVASFPPAAHQVQGVATPLVTVSASGTQVSTPSNPARAVPSAPIVTATPPQTGSTPTSGSGATHVTSGSTAGNTHVTSGSL